MLDSTLGIVYRINGVTAVLRGSTCTKALPDTCPYNGFPAGTAQVVTGSLHLATLSR